MSVIFLLLFVCPIWISAEHKLEKQELLDSASSLRGRLLALANTTLGVEFLQNHFNKLSVNTSVAALTTGTLFKIVKKLEDKILEAIKGLRVIRSAAVTASRSAASSCCGFNEDLSPDPPFAQNVSDDQVCIFGSPAAITVRTFKDAHEEGGSQNALIYFGHSDGSFIQWPAMNLGSVDGNGSCRPFDPRLSPWYVSALRPTPGREVVFLVGASYRTSKGALAADRLMKMLLQAFDTRDKIGVVLFDKSGHLTKPVGCRENSVMQATPSLIEEIEEFVSSRLLVSRIAGAVNFTGAIQNAFSIFTKNPKADKCVVLITADRCNISMDSIIDATFRSKASLHVMAVGDVDFSNDVRRSWSGVESAGVGKCIQANEADLINFPDYLHQLWPPKEGLKFTLPYTDWRVNVNILELNEPCFDSGNFIGVAAFSVVASEFFSVASEVPMSSESYYFLIDSNGIAFYHPKLAYPTAVNEKAMGVRITSLETSPEFKEIADIIRRQHSENSQGDIEMRSILVNVSLARGHSLNDGSKLEERVVTYMWQRVGTFDFTVVLVVPGNLSKDQQQAHVIRFNDLSPSLGTALPLYYQLNLYNASELPTLCVLGTTAAVGNRSSVKLAPDKFKRPSLALTLIDAKLREQLMLYFHDQNSPPPTHLLLSSDSVQSVRNYVIASDIMDNFWSNGYSDERFNVFWRYIGFEDGTFRAYPGNLVPHMYDPRNRPWYNLAMANDGKFVLTPPYMDAGTYTPVVTLAKTLMIVNKEVRKVAGVMGIDFSLKHFGSIINEEIPSCSHLYGSHRCFILDASGYLVYFTDISDLSQGFRTYHILEKEPIVAASMISQGVMVKKSCIARTKPGSETLQKTHEYRFYTIVATEYTEYLAYPDGDDCSDFILVPIPGTNIFLLMARLVGAINVNCTDLSRLYAPLVTSTTTPACSKVLGINELPCYNVRPCLESLSDMSSLLLCPRPVNSATFPHEFEKWVKIQLGRPLPKCYDPLCMALNTSSCNRIGCMVASDGKCVDANATHPPTPTTHSATSLSSSPTKPQPNDDQWLKPFVVVLVLLGVATLLGILLAIMLLRTKRPSWPVVGPAAQARKTPVQAAVIQDKKYVDV